VCRSKDPVIEGEIAHPPGPVGQELSMSTFDVCAPPFSLLFFPFRMVNCFQEPPHMVENISSGSEGFSILRGRLFSLFRSGFLSRYGTHTNFFCAIRAVRR